MILQDKELAHQVAILICMILLDKELLSMERPVKPKIIKFRKLELI